MVQISQRTNYTPKVKAEEANGNKWARIQAELATSARKENQARAQNANNGWGQPSNPFSLENAMGQAQQVGQQLNQTTMGDQANWINQLQQQQRQSDLTYKNDLLQMSQQGSAQQQQMDSIRAQLQRSANSTSAPASDWMNAQNMYGQAQDQARVADDRARATMSAQIAAQQYQQAKAREQNRDNNEAARHLAVIENQKAQQLASTQANAQIATARIGADAGVLSSMFSSFGGGGFRYW